MGEVSPVVAISFMFKVLATADVRQCRGKNIERDSLCAQAAAAAGSAFPCA
jgi:hypothetical protein